MIDPSKSGLYIGDCRELLKQLPDGCVQTCVTSPPYWGLRDYGHEGQIGLEETPEQFIACMVEVFRALRRVLRDDGTLWVNLGDAYAQGGRGSIGSRSGLDGSRHNHDESRRALERRPNARALPRGFKRKDLIGLPWMLAFALRADGWHLRTDIVWSKPNATPESVTDRPTRVHEYLFLLSKSERYFYDVDATRRPQKTLGQRHEGKSGYRAGHPSKQTRTANTRKLHPLGANLRSVWTVSTSRYKGAHFATFPPELIVPCILAGSREGDLVLDPFFGSGTTGAVAEMHGRRWIGFDLGYEDLAKERLARGLTPPKTKRAPKVHEQEELWK